MSRRKESLQTDAALLVRGNLSILAVSRSMQSSFFSLRPIAGFEKSDAFASIARVPRVRQPLNSGTLWHSWQVMFACVKCKVVRSARIRDTHR
jgi:hypothetical protein